MCRPLLFLPKILALTVMFLSGNMSDILNKRIVQQHKIKNMHHTSIKHCKSGTVEPYIIKPESIDTI